MPKVVYGFRKGSRLDYRNVNCKDRPESPFLFQDQVDGNYVKIVVSWHGFLVYDDQVDSADAMISLLRYVSERGCCGRCLPGKKGSGELADLLEELRNDPNLTRLDEAIALTDTIIETSKCSFAPSSASIVRSFLKEFPEKLHKYKDRPKLTYHFHRSAPCTEACPAHIQIPEFIDQLRGKKFANALSIIREHMPFAGLCGRVCPHPCETVCRRSEVDEPINIMNLKQSAWNNEYYKNLEPDIPEKAPSTGKKCAIVGAGPAGLTAAYYLALKGHEVEVFEKFDFAGGMTAAGIPDYREPRDHLKHEVKIIENLGVKFHFGVTLGKDVQLSELKSKYDSVLLAIGAWLPQDSRIDKIEDVKEVLNGIDFLEKVSNYEKPIVNKKVAVIGGGNTAIDCARTSVRFGNDVTIIYRRTKDEMPAEEYEIEEAFEEGIKFEFLASPNSVVVEDGKLKGLVCQKMKLGSPDASGRRSPEAIPNETFLHECDYIIPAIGQKSDLSFIKESDNIETTKWNTIVVDPIYFTTSEDGIFAAGDCVDGVNTVVRAVGNGRISALMMDRYMMSGKPYLEPSEVMERYLYENKIFTYGEMPEPPRPNLARVEVERISMEERLTTFNEVNKPYSESDAATEAKRCMRCMRVGMYGTSSDVVNCGK